MAYIHVAFIIGILSVLFANPASSVSLVCHPYYGRPDLTDCHSILNGPSIPDASAFKGIRRIDRKNHLFQLAGAARPTHVNGDPISDTQWRNRAFVPMFWSKRKHSNSSLLGKANGDFEFFSEV